MPALHYRTTEQREKLRWISNEDRDLNSVNTAPTLNQYHLKHTHNHFALLVSFPTQQVNNFQLGSLSKSQKLRITLRNKRL